MVKSNRNNNNFRGDNVEENEIVIAHRYCMNNKNDLLKDKKCGCFYCLKIFDPKEIEE